MRLIDTDALDIVGAEIDKSTDAASFVKGMKHVIKQIDDAPTVDAVPVVRCKECKYGWKNGRRSCGGTWVFTFHCDIRNCDILAEDFCSYGERKNDKV